MPRRVRTPTRSGRRLDEQEWALDEKSEIVCMDQAWMGCYCEI